MVEKSKIKKKRIQYRVETNSWKWSVSCARDIRKPYVLFIIMVTSTIDGGITYISIKIQKMILGVKLLHLYIFNVPVS